MKILNPTGKNLKQKLFKVTEEIIDEIQEYDLKKYLNNDQENQELAEITATEKIIFTVSKNKEQDSEEESSFEEENDGDEFIAYKSENNTNFEAFTDYLVGLETSNFEIFKSETGTFLAILPKNEKNLIIFYDILIYNSLTPQICCFISEDNLKELNLSEGVNFIDLVCVEESVFAVSKDGIIFVFKPAQSESPLEYFKAEMKNVRGIKQENNFLYVFSDQELKLFDLKTKKFVEINLYEANFVIEEVKLILVEENQTFTILLGGNKGEFEVFTFNNKETKKIFSDNSTHDSKIVSIDSTADKVLVASINGKVSIYEYTQSEIKNLKAFSNKLKIYSAKFLNEENVAIADFSGELHEKSIN